MGLGVCGLRYRLLIAMWVRFARGICFELWEGAGNAREM